MERTIVAKNLNFVLHFPHIYKIFVLKLIFVSTVSPKSFSYWLLSKVALSGLWGFLASESPLTLLWRRPISYRNQWFAWTGFYMISAPVSKGLKRSKCFLFHLQSSFYSQDIKIFVLTYLSCRKTAWLERSG